MISDRAEKRADRAKQRSAPFGPGQGEPWMLEHKRTVPCAALPAPSAASVRRIGLMLATGGRIASASRLDPHTKKGRMSEKKILVVEDHATMRNLCVAVLHSHGFDSIVASNGWEGIHLYRERHEE